MSAERSRKQSDKPNSYAPRCDVTLFVDRSLGRHEVARALRDAGFPVIALHERFGDQTPDEVWLAEAGRKGWIVVSADKKIRYKPDERAALVRNNVRAVFLTSGNLTTAKQVAIITGAAARIQHEAMASQPPVAFSLTKSGELNRLNL